jgi:NAD-dependent SIR2 family protein deacetylase
VGLGLSTLNGVSAEIERGIELLAGRSTVVLTGAGISTDSGIPDYRGDGAPRRTPMTYSDFLSGVEARRRYWARGYVGWRHLSAATPNDGHRAVVAMERSGAASAVITQNVDGLHSAAGSKDVVELHGRMADVVCLECGCRFARARVQEWLSELNPDFDPQAAEIAPDGDVVVDSADGFVVAACDRCGGVLKPDVVFFGEVVPRTRVEHSFALTDEAEAMLVAGSSLAVLSGFRFVRHAHGRGIPVVIVNRGATRADELATLKIDAGCSETLAAFAAALPGPT